MTDATAPAVAAFVGGDAIEDGVVGDVLEVHIEGGIDAQAGVVDFFGAELFFEFAADFFNEPGGDGHFRLGDAQAEGGGAGGFGFLFG